MEKNYIIRLEREQGDRPTGLSGVDRCGPGGQKNYVTNFAFTRIHGRLFARARGISPRNICRNISWIGAAIPRNFARVARAGHTPTGRDGNRGVSRAGTVENHARDRRGKKKSPRINKRSGPDSRFPWLIPRLSEGCRGNRRRVRPGRRQYLPRRREITAEQRGFCGKKRRKTILWKAQSRCRVSVRCPTVLWLPPPDGGARDLSQVHSPFALTRPAIFCKIQPRSLYPARSSPHVRTMKITYLLSSRETVREQAGDDRQRSSENLERGTSKSIQCSR